MERSCYNIVVYYGLFIAVLMDKVVVQSKKITVEAAVGESVILLCLSSRYEKDVFWRHNNTKTVYDIIDGKADFYDQEAAYRGRVESFPSEFEVGNYSIKLSGVQHSDTGTYSCQMPHSSTRYVELKIKERLTRFKSLRLQRMQISVQTNGGVRRQSDSLLCFSVALLGLSVWFSQ